MTRTPSLLLALLLVACGPTPDVGPSASVPSVEPDATEPAGAAIHGQLAFVAGLDPQIHLLDLATGESRQLTRLRPEHAELRAEGPMRPVLSCGFGPNSLAWSPDGSMLAFSYGACDGVLYLVDLDGELTRVADGRSPAWSPDGSRLVFVPNVPFCMDAAGCGDAPAPGAWSLQVVDVAAGAGPVPLSLDPSMTSAGQPAFSPDGSLIAFSGPLPRDEADPEIFGAAYVVAADGSNPRLVARGAWPPGWLPDGRLLIVEEGSSDIHAMDLETAETVPLGGSEGPAFASPDGSRLLLTRTDPETGASTAHLTTLNGEALAGLAGYPLAWAPDSAAAVVSDSEDGGAALVFVGRDGEPLGRYSMPDAVNGIGPAAWRPGS